MLKKTTRIAAVALILVTLSGVVFLFMNRSRSAFIDYNTVYNNCKLKISLEKDLQRVTQSRKSELDSMQLELSFLSQAIQSGKTDNTRLAAFEDAKTRFLTLQERYEQENMRLKETYFTQIRQEINDKAKLFAAQHGYDYFFAAMGDGALMYASESQDVTKAFQAYLDK